MVIFQPSFFSSNTSYASRGKIPHNGWGVLCLNQACEQHLHATARNNGRSYYILEVLRYAVTKFQLIVWCRLKCLQFYM